MTQLILDGIQLPESKDGGYTATPVELGTMVQMISGRIVKEVRGNAWSVSYQYGYFDDDMRQKVLAACNKGSRQPIKCGILLPDSVDGKLYYSDFFVTVTAQPRFRWSKKQQGKLVPLWANYEIQLREVKPHD